MILLLKHGIINRYTHTIGIDDPLGVEVAGKLYTYHKDTLGSIRSITDSTQMVVNTYTYDSFGNTAQTGTFNQPYGYTGREWDKETGLYYYRARYYDPMEGRFISKDPIGFAGGDVNLYGYVKNNPVNLTDPTGLAPGGLSLLQWWSIRVGLGALTGVPMTVGAGIGLTSPTALSDPTMGADGKWYYPNGDPAKTPYVPPTPPPGWTYDPASGLWIPPKTPVICKGK